MILVGNWKSCILQQQIQSWLQQYRSSEYVTQVLLVPFPYLKWIAEYQSLQSQDWILGAQDVSSLQATAAVSTDMLVDCKVQVVCIGHSEVRAAAHLSYADIKKRVQAVEATVMTTLLCIANVQDEELDVLPEQLTKELWIAYEPQWAIGQEQCADVNFIHDQLLSLDECLKKRYHNVSDKIRWLYGGSVNASNITALAQISLLDGFLVGRSSLKYEDWSSLIQCI